jgi:malate/lactate dehydrogenase
MSPTGENLYMIGTVNNGGTELITWQINTNTYYSTALAITYSGAQITYGSDDVLYVIAPSSEGGGSSTVFTLNPSTGTLTVIEEDLVPLPGALSDITLGPIM